MIYKTIQPPADLRHLIREFWIVENDDPEVVTQKIIPDGFSELIVHYGDPYQIKLGSHWELQSRILLSTQISGHFFLQNTGRSGMIGITMLQTAPYTLFDTEIPKLTDSVRDLRTVAPSSARVLEPLTRKERTPDDHIRLAISCMTSLVRPVPPEAAKAQAVADEMISAHGMIEIEAMAARHGMSRRHLERQFKQVVGITPKLFARIQQFNYIFKCLGKHDRSWVDVALKCGYFDQSHFIKNFRAFTGTSPLEYGFDEQNLANFFLQRH